MGTPEETSEFVGSRGEGTASAQAPWSWAPHVRVNVGGSGGDKIGAQFQLCLGRGAFVQHKYPQHRVEAAFAGEKSRSRKAQEREAQHGPWASYRAQQISYGRKSAQQKLATAQHVRNLYIWDRALPRLVRSRCGGHRSRVRALLVPDFPRSLLNFCCLSRVELQRDCDAPVAYGALDESGDLTKDAI